MHMSILNTIILVVKYQTNSCTKEVLKSLLESVQPTFQCKWMNKIEVPSSQKHPDIISAICKLCNLVHKKFPSCNI